MRYTVSRWLVSALALSHAHISAISMVYNFRIAQITKQPIVEQSPYRKHIILLPFEQWREKYNGPHQEFIGALGSFIYDSKPYYFRTDFAVSHIHETDACVTTFSGTETDDILFTVGRGFVVNKKTDITLSGLFGIPTHRIYRLQHIDFGYSQVGFGIQLDGIYALSNINTLLYGGRYIHFVPRSALDTECEKHKFTLGNIGDLFLGHKSNWGHQGFEFGYTFRARFGAKICPSLDEIIQKTNYLRSNFYAVYKFKFFINDHPSRLLFYISYGFDHKPKVYGNKYIVTVWSSLNISF